METDDWLRPPLKGTAQRRNPIVEIKRFERMLRVPFPANQ